MVENYKLWLVWVHFHCSITAVVHQRFAPMYYCGKLRLCHKQTAKSIDQYWNIHCFHCTYHEVYFTEQSCQWESLWNPFFTVKSPGIVIIDANLYIAVHKVTSQQKNQIFRTSWRKILSAKLEKWSYSTHNNKYWNVHSNVSLIISLFNMYRFGNDSIFLRRKPYEQHISKNIALGASKFFEWVVRQKLLIPRSIRS